MGREASSYSGRAAPLIISSGSEDAIRAMGLRYKVALDATFSVGPPFGANGTPMAVLVDAEGKIASDLAVGADAVLALAKGAPVAAA